MLYKQSHSFTSKQTVYVFGAGGHGKVVADAIESNGGYVCYVDDNPVGKRTMMPGELPDSARVALGIGDNFARERVVERLQKLEKRLIFPNVYHRDAYKFMDLYESEFQHTHTGRVIMVHAVVNPGTKLGAFCIINTGATVDHDCVIGDYAHVGPGVNLCGGVQVGKRTLVGVGSCAVPKVKIGSDAIIGAGSVIVSDIPDGVLAYGNPCKVIKEIER